MVLDFGSNLFGEKNQGLLQEKRKRIISIPNSAWTTIVPGDPVETIDVYWSTWKFADDVNRGLNAAIEIPDDYDGGNIYCNIYWTANAIVGVCDWVLRSIQGRIGIDKDTNNTLSGSQGETTAPSTSNAIVLTRINITRANDILFQRGDLLSLQFLRSGSSGDDTMIGDAELLMVTIEYTGV